MINFIKYRLIYFAISSLVIGFGFFSFLSHGYPFSLDFVGGGLLEFQSVSKSASDKARGYINQKKINADFQKTNTGFVLKSKDLDKKTADRLAKELEKKYKLKKIRFEVVGPSIGKENIQKTIIASIIATLSILVYVGLTYKNWRFAVGAIASLFHDLLVLLGFWSVAGWLFGYEFDVLFITALLTTMSFSVHDTIVIFDKIQDEKKHQQNLSLEESTNLALNLTIMRSLNNSLTVVIMLSALLILGGDSLRPFVLSLLVGTITGTYSSPFVATPVYYLLEKRRQP